MSTETRPIIDVMFRAQVDPLTREVDNVTAVFPAIPATTDPLHYLSYAHIGQHGAAHRDWVRYNTRPATPEEYGPLLAELRSIYETDRPSDPAVTLRVVTRVLRKHDRARTKELRALT